MTNEWTWNESRVSGPADENVDNETDDVDVKGSDFKLDEYFRHQMILHRFLHLGQEVDQSLINWNHDHVQYLEVSTVLVAGLITLTFILHVHDLHDETHGMSANDEEESLLLF